MPFEKAVLESGAANKRMFCLLLYFFHRQDIEFLLHSICFFHYVPYILIKGRWEDVIQIHKKKLQYIDYVDKDSYVKL